MKKESIDVIKAGALAVILGLGIGCSTNQEKDELEQWYYTVDETTGLSCKDIENLDAGKYEKYVRQDCENFFEWEKAIGEFDVFGDGSITDLGVCTEQTVEWAENYAIATNRVTTSNVLANGYVHNLFLKNCAKENYDKGLRDNELYWRCKGEHAEMQYDDAFEIFKAQRDSCFGKTDQPNHVPNVPTEIVCENGSQPYEGVCYPYADKKRIQAVIDSLETVAPKIVDPTTGFSCESQKEEVVDITTNPEFCTCRTLSNYESLVNGDGKVKAECVASKSTTAGDMEITEAEFDCRRNLLYYAVKPEPGSQNVSVAASMAYFKKRTKCAEAAFVQGLRGAEIEEVCYEDYSKYQVAFQNQSEECSPNGGTSARKISCLKSELERYAEMGVEPTTINLTYCNLPEEIFR